jgi:hypothetical protein
MVPIIANLDAGGTRIHDIRHLVLDRGRRRVRWTPDSKWVLVSLGEAIATTFTGSRWLTMYRANATSITGGLVADASFSPDQKWILALVWPVPVGRALRTRHAPPARSILLRGRAS